MSQIKERMFILSEELGKKIKTLRKTRGLSQEDLGYLLGLRRSTISNYEIGRRSPSLKEMERIAHILGVGLDYFGFKKEKNVYDLVARAKMVFEDDEIPDDKKADVYKEIMRLYLNLNKWVFTRFFAFLVSYWHYTLKEVSKIKLTICSVAAKLGVSPQSIRIGLQRGELPFGHAIKTSGKYTYVIYEKKLKEYLDYE